MSALAQLHVFRSEQEKYDRRQPMPRPLNARDEILDLVTNAEVSEKCVPYFSETFGIENHLTPLDVILEALNEKDAAQAFLLALINHPEALRDVRIAAGRYFADRHAVKLEQARADAAFEARFDHAPPL